MANLGTNFDSSLVEPEEGIKPLPAGWYAMKIIASAWKVVKKNHAHQFLELILSPDERYHPDLKGRQVTDRLNLRNSNEDTKIWAKSRLSAICGAVKVQVVNDSEQLHNIVMAVKVGIEAANSGYDAKNKVGKYDDVSSRFSQTGKPLVEGEPNDAAAMFANPPKEEQGVPQQATEQSQPVPTQPAPTEPSQAMPPLNPSEPPDWTQK